MDSPSLAQRLLELALRDDQAFRKLSGDPDVHESIWGFHAQQAVEKALKAVLAHAGVAVRRTHDIAELLDVIADTGLVSPPHADRLDELNPYAVEYRYGLVDLVGLDRTETGLMLNAVLSWSSVYLANGCVVHQDPDHF